MSELEENTETMAALQILDNLNEKIKNFIENIGGPEKYNEFIDLILNEKVIK